MGLLSDLWPVKTFINGWLFETIILPKDTFYKLNLVL